MEQTNDKVSPKAKVTGLSPAFRQTKLVNIFSKIKPFLWKDNGISQHAGMSWTEIFSAVLNHNRNKDATFQIPSFNSNFFIGQTELETKSLNQSKLPHTSADAQRRALWCNMVDSKSLPVLQNHNEALCLFWGDFLRPPSSFPQVFFLTCWHITSRIHRELCCFLWRKVDFRSLKRL